MKPIAVKKDNSAEIFFDDWTEELILVTEQRREKIGKTDPIYSLILQVLFESLDNPDDSPWILC
ncbi:MAG: hypothetical protein QXL34_06555 [Thermosphaera sp.]